MDKSGYAGVAVGGGRCLTRGHEDRQGPKAKRDLPDRPKDTSWAGNEKDGR